VSSGLIYAVIVALWAVVLVPMWLRRHDEVTESRSIDRFQGAMHILSRRPAAARASASQSESVGDRREVLQPKRSRRAIPDGAEEALASPAARAGRRRARVLAVFLILIVLVITLALLHVVPMWAVAIPVVLLVGYLLQVRHAIRSARASEFAARRARAAQLRAARRPGTTAGLRRPEVVAEADVFFDVQADYSVAPAARTPMPATASVALDESADEGDFYDAVAERVWEPVPVPLPTYVSAPKAPRSVRVIDLTMAGAWTSGRLDPDAVAEDLDADDEEPIRQARPRDGIVTGEVLVERRQAVGD
jgi:hypothetical protein